MSAHGFDRPGWSEAIDRVVAKTPEQADLDGPPHVRPAESATVHGFGEALVVGPDDYLVVNHGPRRISEQQMAELRADLERRWPAIAGRIVFMAGVESLAVIRR